MKIKCPYCQFKFDTGEKLEPPFKLGDTVKFIKRHIEKYWIQGFRKDFDYKGKVIGYKLIRAKNHCNKHIKNKDAWLIDIEYLPFSKKDGLSHKEFWDYEIKKYE